MSPLCKSKFVTVVFHHKLIKKPSLTLHVFTREPDVTRSRENRLCMKGIPLAMSCRAGSMTVEAAMIIPLFIFFFINLMSVMEMMRLHCNLELALWKNGKVMTVVGHAFESAQDENEWIQVGGTLLTDYALYLEIVYELGEDYLDHSPLTYGKKGLNFLESSYMENDCIDIKLTYQVSPDFNVPGFPLVRLANRYYARAWTGYCVSEEEEEQAKEYVYVTMYGQVFHVKLDCGYLNRTIEAVQVSGLGNMRNNAGEQYTICEYCGKFSSQDTVYITPTGGKYHFTVSCPSLKRTISILERTEAEENYRPCSRCVVQNGG